MLDFVEFICVCEAEFKTELVQIAFQIATSVDYNCNLNWLSCKLN